MASAWGASFGGAWGDSWGASESAGTSHAPLPGGGGGGGGGSFHYPLEVIERLEVPEAVVEAIVEVASRQEDDRSQVDQTAMLVAALDALGIEWKRQYDEALTAYREAYLRQQVALAQEAARRETRYWDAAVVLLLLQ